LFAGAYLPAHWLRRLRRVPPLRGLLELIDFAVALGKSH
jgi:hypothetical protein